MSGIIKHIFFLLFVGIFSFSASAEIKQYADYSGGSGFEIKELTAGQVDNLTVLGKVWGFVKYHHPALDDSAPDVFNIDYELFELFAKVVDASQEERNKVLVDWIRYLGNFKAVPDEYSKVLNTSIPAANTDFTWLADTEELGKDLSGLLIELQFAERTDNRYATIIGKQPKDYFSGEEVYEDVTNYDYGYGLLSLFRFWNVIEYYYPYKQLIGRDWDDVLREYIVRFSQPDGGEIRLEEARMTTEIHDSHTGLNCDFLWGEYRLPVSFVFAQGKLVVLFNHILSTDGIINTGVEELRQGDEVISVNGQGADHFVELAIRYHSDSNGSRMLRTAAFIAACVDAPSATVRVKRGNETLDIQCTASKELPPYSSDTFHYDIGPYNYGLINEEIGYIYFGEFNPWLAGRVLRDFENTKGVIIDLRRYPNYFLAPFITDFLYPEPTECALFQKPYDNSPGYFYEEETILGGGAKNTYKGNIIILVNEYTQSSGEYMAMLAQVYNKCVTVGSQTAGTNGNSGSLKLPNGREMWLTLHGAYYADGSGMQRTGVRIDHYVHPTIEGIAAGRDELLDYALNLLK